MKNYHKTIIITPTSFYRIYLDAPYGCVIYWAPAYVHEIVSSSTKVLTSIIKTKLETLKDHLQEEKVQKKA